MSEQTEVLSLEERRLAFDERKWADELSLRKSEQEAKARENSWWAKLFSPLTATIMVGIVTVGGSVFATLSQNKTSLELERTKYETAKEVEAQKFSFSKDLEIQKQQHELILKMISVNDSDQALKNLKFLAETKLLADEALATRIIAAAAKGVPLTSPNQSNSSILRNCLTHKPGAREGLLSLMKSPSSAGLLALMSGASPEEAADLLRRATAAGIC
jgi:hypothetical protein